MTVTADPSEEGTAESTKTRSVSNTNNTAITGIATSTAQIQSQSHSSAMSLTYSDFIYTRNGYTPSSVYPEVGRDERRLPSDFKPIRETNVPLMQVDEDANHDFIIVAEFSEQEGPIPLCTIPNDADAKTDIKLSDFVVHLMSTDYLVNTVGQFRICQDTQVMRKNVFPNVHVFMQYFTLYDIKARGFVRPFCFGYVSKDHIKLEKYISFLMTEFGKITSVLEHCNRAWFAKELQIYLQKLENAKDAYIKEHSSSSKDSSGVNEDLTGDEKKSQNQSCGSTGDLDLDSESQDDVYVDSESVTLAQIAHQYSEVKNILTIVQSFKHSSQTFNENVIFDVCSFLNRNSEAPISQFLKRISVPSSSTGTTWTGAGSICRTSFDSGSPSLHSTSPEFLNIPLVHPLRFKGEALRPLTVLGQLGAVYLVGKLMQVYSCCRMDIIFSEMSECTVAFRQHFQNLSLKQNNNVSWRSPGGSSEISKDLDNSLSGTIDWLSTEEAGMSHPEETPSTSSGILSPFELGQASHLLWSNYKNNELHDIIEKLHSSAPFSTPDNRSGSYHTVSEEEESDLNKDHIGAFDNSVLESTIDTVGSVLDDRRRTLGSLPPTHVDSLRFHSFSSDEDVSISPKVSQKKRLSISSSEEIILKEPWWIHCSKKLSRGVPGYGLASFFRRYHATAHHILYSILLGRPIIICGEESMSQKISKLITSLIPLIPLPPSSSGSPQKSWKLLRWHQGILIQSHIESYKLIGLCIPDKLEVFDLIPSRLVTLVTILSADRKTILGGPAYSGELLLTLEKKIHSTQKHLRDSDSDLSILSYIGALYADIEAKVYMYKSLLEERDPKHKGKTLSNSSSIIPSIFRDLNLRASDLEIVKHLGNLIADPSDCVNIL